MFLYRLVRSRLYKTNIDPQYVIEPWAVLFLFVWEGNWLCVLCFLIDCRGVM